MKRLVATLLFNISFLSNIYAKEAMPKPECLAPAIDFWEDVFEKYDASNGIIYDVKNYEIKRIVSLPEEPKKRKAIVKEVKKVENQRLQTGVKETYLEGIARYHRYKKMVRAQLIANNLPLELMALPLIESAYNPKAISKAGAIGLWQIMPSTARLYGFKPNKLKDPLYNTKAAMVIIRDKYRKLGSWPLGITAYNHGLMGVKRAVDFAGSKDICVIIDSYRGKRFGVASKSYYATFLAAKNLLKKEDETFAVLDKKKN